MKYIIIFILLFSCKRKNDGMPKNESSLIPYFANNTIINSTGVYASDSTMTAIKKHLSNMKKFKGNRWYDSTQVKPVVERIDTVYKFVFINDTTQEIRDHIILGECQSY